MLSNRSGLSIGKTIVFCLVVLSAIVAFASTLLSPVPGATATVLSDTYVRVDLVQITNDGGRLDWSPDGATIYFDRRGADELYDVWSMNPDGSNEVCITCDRLELPNNHQGNPEIDPGGRYLVFQVEKAEHAGTIGGVNSEPGIARYNDLWIWDKQEDTFYPLTDVHPELTSGSLHPHFSNDGTQLFWSNLEGAVPDGDPYHVYGDIGLAVADFVASPAPHLENVTYYNPGENPVYLETHGFGPDDNWLYFSCTPHDNMEDVSADICRMDFSNPTEITSLTHTSGLNGEFAAWDEHAHLSPLNDAYVWASSQPYDVPENNMPAINETLRLDLWLMGTDGNNQQRLTYFNEPGHPEYTGYRAIVSDNDWNPDGSQVIIYVQFPDNVMRNHIWLLSLEPPAGTPTPTPTPTEIIGTPTPTITPPPTVTPTPTPVNAPVVNLLSPLDGAELTTRHVTATFTTSNHDIGAYGESHIHFYLDDYPEPLMFFNGNDPAQFGQQTVQVNFQPTALATWISSDTLRFNNLTNGLHTLTARLVDAQGNVEDNPGASQTITFTVNVPPDDLAMPAALILVKEEPNPNDGMGAVFDSQPDVVGDLYLLSPVAPDGVLTPLTNVAAVGGGVTDPELSWDGQRVLFSMRQNADDTWHIWEMNLDGSGLQQITFDPPFRHINDQDPEYLPDGRIIFASDRRQIFQSRPFAGVITTQLYTANADGTDLRMVEPNPSSNINPQVFPDGRISFDRWDYLTSLRSRYTVWDMNQDGSSGFVSYGGFSPPFYPPTENAIGIERRSLADGQMVGIFTTREQLPGRMGIFDNRGGDVADLPGPLYVGPEGLYRTPNTLTSNELVFSYSAITDTLEAQFGLYSMSWSGEQVLVDDPTVSTAHGPGTNYFFRVYNIQLAEPGRIYIEVTGSADHNNDDEDDDLWVMIDGDEYLARLTQRLDGEKIHSLTHTFRVDVDLNAGIHEIKIAVDRTPTLEQVRIVHTIQAGEPVLLYDDPATNEISPIPVRSRILPPTQPENINPERNWGTFVVRDTSLRGDASQPDDQSPEGDPNYPYHLDPTQLAGLRVYQSINRHDLDEDILAGVSLFEAVRVIGVAPSNETGTTIFTTFANHTTAWDLIGHNGAAIVHERVWNSVQPGEVRSCTGCHEGPFPYTPREIGPLPEATDLRARGEVYTFVDHALPILQNRCQTCHLGDNPGGGLNLRGDRNTFDALVTPVPERLPEAYMQNGDARGSFFFQLLTGDAHGDEIHQARIDAINSSVDHTALLTPEEYFKLATWIDTGGGFAYLIAGEATTVPQVIGVLPPPDGNNIPQNSGIVVRFNAPIDRATVDQDTFTLIADGAQTPVAGDWAWGGNRELLFRPIAPLPQGQYELTLGGGILDIKADTVGQPITTTFSISFTVAAEQDVAPPQIVQLLPDGSLTTPISPVVARFSEAINPGSITEHTLWVKSAQGYDVDGRVGVSSDGREAAFVPWQPFAAGESYTLYVSGDVRDLAGNALGAPGSVISHTFTIQMAPNPQHHSLIVAADAGIDAEALTFNTNGDRVLVANQYDDAVTLFDSTTWEALRTYDLSVGAGPLDVAFSPDGDLAYVLNYLGNNVQVLRLADGATLTTFDGMGEPYRLAINQAGTTLYVTDIGDPPAVHQLDVDPNSPGFGQITRSLSLTEIPHDIVINPDDSLLYITSNESLITLDADLWVRTKTIPTTYGSVKNVTLSPDGRQAIIPDTDRRILQVFDLIVGRHVIDLPWEAVPEYVVYSPDGQFIYVTEQTTNVIAILDAATLQIVDHLPISVAADGNIAALAFGADGHTVVALENNVTSKLWVFYRADQNDVTPPMVTQTWPGDGQTGIPVFGPVHIDLSEAVDNLSANEQTVFLTDGSGVVSSTVSVDAGNQSLWLHPLQWLTPGITYTLHISTGLRDLAGNPLAAEVTSAFTAAATPTPARLGLWVTPAAGNNLRGVAVTPDGGRVLVTTYGGTLRFFDVDNWDSRWLDLGGSAGHITINPAGTLAYVLRPTQNDVVVIDLAAETPIDMDGQTGGLQGIPVGASPFRSLLHPSQPLLYVVNEDSGDVSLIDTLTRQEIARWPVNGVAAEDNNAHGIALSADEGQLYVTYDSTLAVLDAGDGHLVKQLDGFSAFSLRDVVVPGDGNQVWVASATTNELIAIDMRTDTVVARIPTGEMPTWLALSLDGETLYAINKNDGGVSLYHWRTGTLLSRYDNAGAANGLALSPDGEWVYVTNEGAGEVLVYKHVNVSDATGPQVLALQPHDGQVDVPPYDDVRIDLSEAVGILSANEQTVFLTDGSGVVSSTVSVNAGNQSLWLHPLQWLTPGITYTLHISTGLRDLAGNPLAAEVTSAFTAAATPTPARLGLWVTPAAGNNLRGVAVTPDGGRVLVTTYGGTLRFFDVDNWDSRWLDLGGSAGHITINPAGTLAYVLRPTQNDVVVIDLAAETPIDMDGQTGGLQGIPVGASPFSSLHHPDQPFLYVVNQESRNVSLIDTLTQQEIARWPVNGGAEDGHAHAAALSPDGQYLYVTYDGGLSILDAANGEMVKAFDDLPGWGFSGIVVADNGDRVWFASPATNQLLMLDTRIDAVTAQVSVGNIPTWLALSADGETIVVSNQGGGVSLVHWRTGTLVSQYDFSGPAYGLTLSPDGQRIYVANDGADAVMVYQYGELSDVTPPQVIQVRPGDGENDVPLYTSVIVSLSEAVDRLTVDERTVWLSAGDSVVNGTLSIGLENDLVWFRPDVSLNPGVTYTLHISSGVRDFAGNALGEEVATSFTTATPLDPVTLVSRPQAFSSYSPMALAMSPDNALLAVSNRWQDKVTLLNPTTMWPTAPLIPTGDEPKGLVFSNDGSLLYIAHDGTDSLVVLDVATRQVQQTFTGLVDAEMVVLSPDGTMAYVTGYTGGGVDLIDLSSGQVIPQWHVLDRPGQPVFAPDGTLYVPAFNRLWRYNDDGTWTDLYMGGYYTLDIAISPDGRYAFLSQPSMDRLQIIDLYLWQVVASLSVPDDPRQMALSSDGRVLVMVSTGAGAIQVVDILTLTTLNTTFMPGSSPLSLAWDEADDWLFVGNLSGFQVSSFDFVYP